MPRKTVRASRESVDRLGFGRISEKMAEEIERGGGHVHCGWRVISAEHDGAAIRGITVSDGHREQVVEADEYISSIPMTELAAILTPPDAVSQCIMGVPMYFLFEGGIIMANVLMRMRRKHQAEEEAREKEDDKADD